MLLATFGLNAFGTPASRVDTHLGHGTDLAAAHALVVSKRDLPPYYLAEGQGSWYEMRDACAASANGGNRRIIAVPTSQEQMDAVRSLVQAAHGDVRHWVEIPHQRAQGRCRR